MWFCQESRKGIWANIKENGNNFAQNSSKKMKCYHAKFINIDETGLNFKMLPTKKLPGSNASVAGK